jgi:2-iminobutanoate/2-iminopropanoate deaminase
MSGRQAISAPGAPAPIGPYSPALRAGNLLFVSGQIALDPATGNLVPGDVTAQAEQVMKNLSALLAAGGATFADVVKTTIYLADLGDFAAVNEVYGRHLGSPAPARATVEVPRLPKDARVEIDAVAVLDGREG